MPDLILTPARATVGSIKPLANGWVKSIKVALRIGWLRGRLRSQRLVTLRSRQLRGLYPQHLRSRRTRVVSARVPEVTAAVLAGVGVEYLLDPADGKRRRKTLQARLLSTGRRLGRRGVRQARYLEGKGEGAIHDAMSTPDAPADDQALADRVRTEVFRAPDAPKGDVNVGAVDGIVYLRGEVASSQEIDRLIEEARQVPGVRAVESLLHTPGTPAPMGGAA